MPAKPCTLVDLTGSRLIIPNLQSVRYPCASIPMCHLSSAKGIRSSSFFSPNEYPYSFVMTMLVEKVPVCLWSLITDRRETDHNLLFIPSELNVIVFFRETIPSQLGVGTVHNRPKGGL